MKKVYLYKGFERLWHCLQAISIIMLILTGFEIHGNWHIFGFQKAHKLHVFFGWLLAVLIVFAIFWMITIGQWKMYVTRINFEEMKETLRYYMSGIFKGEPHPGKKTPEDKFNPLQKITYFVIIFLLVPYQVIMGILYYFYNDLPKIGIHVSLVVIATLHVIGAFLFFAFLIAHIYLGTTGHTVFSYIKGIITGWEEVEE